MADRLKGKVAIVTGAGSSPGEGIGNGKATAILYAQEGASVMLVDRDLTAADETRKIIEDEGGKCFIFQADVTRSDQCGAMAEACIKKYGTIDILHNNVGVTQRPLGGLLEVEEELWDRLMNVNLKSMFLTCRAVLPQMLRQKQGVILNISSVSAVRIGYPQFIYSITKAGVNQLTVTMAWQYGDKGIRVNAIMPGAMLTPMTMPLKDAMFGGDLEKMREARIARIPMKRMGDAWDVAYASVFLVSDEAKYITGQVLAVDGGMLCRG